MKTWALLYEEGKTWESGPFALAWSPISRSRTLDEIGWSMISFSDFAFSRTLTIFQAPDLSLTKCRFRRFQRSAGSSPVQRRIWMALASLASRKPTTASTSSSVQTSFRMPKSILRGPSRPSVASSSAIPSSTAQRQNLRVMVRMFFQYFGEASPLSFAQYGFAVFRVSLAQPSGITPASRSRTIRASRDVEAFRDRYRASRNSRAASWRVANRDNGTFSPFFLNQAAIASGARARAFTSVCSNVVTETCFPFQRNMATQARPSRGWMLQERSSRADALSIVSHFPEIGEKVERIIGLEPIVTSASDTVDCPDSPAGSVSIAKSKVVKCYWALLGALQYTTQTPFSGLLLARCYPFTRPARSLPPRNGVRRFVSGLAGLPPSSFGGEAARRPLGAGTILEFGSPYRPYRTSVTCRAVSNGGSKTAIGAGGSIQLPTQLFKNPEQLEPLTSFGGACGASAPSQPKEQPHAPIGMALRDLLQEQAEVFDLGRGGNSTLSTAKGLREAPQNLPVPVLLWLAPDQAEVAPTPSTWRAPWGR